MDVNFKRPPKLWDLATMSGPRNFFLPTIINAENIRAFIQNGCRHNKFVYHRESGRFAIAGNDDIEHQKIAKDAFGETGEEGAIAALLTNNRALKMISLGAESGYYGTPTKNEFELVAEHIKDLLEKAGIEAGIEENEFGLSVLYGKSSVSP